MNSKTCHSERIPPSREEPKNLSDLEAERLEPAAIALRLHNAEAMLVSALNLIGAMQPVVSMAEAFVDYTIPGNESYPGLRKAVAKYRAYVIENQKSKIENESHHHLSSERDDKHPLHRQPPAP